MGYVCSAQKMFSRYKYAKKLSMQAIKEENQHNRLLFHVGRHYTFEWIGQERQTLKLQKKLSLQLHGRCTTGIIGLERNALFKHDKLSFHVHRLCTDTNTKEDRRWTRWSRHPFICQESQQEQWNGVSVSQPRTERTETNIDLLFIPSSATLFSLRVSQQFLFSSARDNSATNWQSTDNIF